MSLLLAAPLAGTIALVGCFLKWLTRLGALAAAGVGTAALYRMGVPGGFLLALFFVSGSVLSHASSPRSPGGARSQRRNARQVLANGGCAAMAALLPAPTIGWALYAGALASAQADTWATETGAHSLLGAAVQGVFFCGSCQSETEDSRHSCGTKAIRVRGAKWLDNNGVNFVATGSGAAITLFVWLAVSSLF